MRFSDKEYNTLDYYLTKSKLYDSGFYIRQDKEGNDYFKDYELKKRYSLKSGLKIVYESVADITQYPITIQEGLKDIFKKYLGL